MGETIISDENHQGYKRIFGVPWPYREDEAVPKGYVDQAVAAGGGGGVSGILDCGSPLDTATGAPIIDCGGIT